MSDPCLAEQCARRADLKRLDRFKWLILGMLAAMWLAIWHWGALMVPTLVVPSAEALRLGSAELEGTGSPGKTVELLQDGQIILTAVVDAAGNWSSSLGSIAPGDYTFSARMRGDAGQVSRLSHSLHFTFPVRGEDQFHSNPARSGEFSMIGSNMPTGRVWIDGVGVPKNRVEIFVDNEFLGAAQVGPDQKWVLDVEASLVVGEHQLLARLFDEEQTTLAEFELPPLTIPEIEAENRDADEDRVSDAIDQCAYTRANAEVDQFGCEVDADQDGDGVINSRNFCPGSPAEMEVNPFGCASGRTITLDGIQFEPGSVVMTKGSTPALKRVVKALSRLSGLRLEIGGHTDAEGGASANRYLS